MVRGHERDLILDIEQHASREAPALSKLMCFEEILQTVRNALHVGRRAEHAVLDCEKVQELGEVLSGAHEEARTH
jgi:hypothetical protein